MHICRDHSLILAHAHIEQQSHYIHVNGGTPPVELLKAPACLTFLDITALLVKRGMRDISLIC